MAKRKRETGQKKSRLSGRGCLWIVLLCAGITLFAQAGARNRSANATVVPQSTRVGVVRPTATRTPKITEVQPTLTNVDMTAQVENKATRISFTAKDMRFFTEFNGNEPENDLLLVLQGDFLAEKDTCIYARNVRLILDDVEYPPDRGWMYEVRYVMDLDVNFPGPISGQCIDGGINTPTLMVFDVPAMVENASLKLFEDEQIVDVEWGAVVAMAATSAPITPDTPTSINTTHPLLTVTIKLDQPTRPTLAASATRTIRPTLTASATKVPATRTLQPTNVPVASTFYAVGNANARSCPQTTCEIVDRLAGGDMVSVIGIEEGEAVGGNTSWRQVNLNGQIAYVHSSLLSSSKPVVNSGGNTGSVVVSTAPPNASVPTVPPVVWSCSGDIYNCGDFATWNEANAYFQACPGDPSKLDGNNDGSPCDSLR